MTTITESKTTSNRLDSGSHDMSNKLTFKRINQQNISEVWKYCKEEKGRTCDFSYGGLLMWSDIFDYEYAICDDTLFIKGRNEEDMESTAFSLPVGKLSLEESLKILSEWTQNAGMPLILTAVPEYALEELMKYHPKEIKELQGWADYIYDIEKLATVAGKKMAKKRNHVNQFIHAFGADCYERITPNNLSDVEEFMHRLEMSPAPSASAAIERRLAMHVLESSEDAVTNYFGGLLRVDGKVVAFTIGDIKGDTLFIHIEKADHSVPGSSEMINKAFAEDMLKEFPYLKYVNREDDSNDEGLRKAKMSYHPVELLNKYSVKF